MLNGSLINMVSEYLSMPDDFYKLFPEAGERRVKLFYDHKTQTIDGLPHSINDRAILVLGNKNMDSAIIITWYKYGKKHRDGGPAEITVNLKKCATREFTVTYHVHQYYYNDGLLHRIDGPASISNIFHEFFIYGVSVKAPRDTYEVPRLIVPKYYDCPTHTPVLVDYNMWIHSEMSKKQYYVDAFKKKTRPGLFVSDTEIKAVEKYQENQELWEGVRMGDIHSTVSLMDSVIIDDCLNICMNNRWYG